MSSNKICHCIGGNLIMYKILIVEDNSLITDFLINVISELYPKWSVYNANSYKDAINIAINEDIDLFILDYELNKDNLTENGFNLGIELKNIPKYKNTPMVFETSYPNHIFSIINELHCIYYLIKPYEKADIQHMLNKILNYNNLEKRFSIKDPFGINSYINDNDIIYVNTNRHTLEIFTTANSFLCMNYSLSQLIKESDILIQCHKSYAINPKFITNLDKTTYTVTLQFNDKVFSIPIGRKYKETLLRKMD